MHAPKIVFSLNKVTIVVVFITIIIIVFVVVVVIIIMWRRLLRWTTNLFHFSLNSTYLTCYMLLNLVKSSF